MCGDISDGNLIDRLLLTHSRVSLAFLSISKHLEPERSPSPPLLSARRQQSIVPNEMNL